MVISNSEVSKATHSQVSCGPVSPKMRSAHHVSPLHNQMDLAWGDVRKHACFMMMLRGDSADTHAVLQLSQGHRLLWDTRT